MYFVIPNNSAFFFSHLNNTAHMDSTNMPPWPSRGQGSTNNNAPNPGRCCWGLHRVLEPGCSPYCSEMTLPASALAVRFGQQLLAQADELGGDFHQLVFVDEVDGLFQ